MHLCYTFNRIADLCGKTDTQANRNSYACADSDPDADSQANRNACTHGNTCANSNAETFGHTDSGADRDADSRDYVVLSAPDRLWDQQQQCELPGKTRAVKSGLPSPDAGPKLDFYNSLSSSKRL